jgi:hypothetical protein
MCRHRNPSGQARGLKRPAKVPADQLMRSMRHGRYSGLLIQGILESDMPVQHRLHPRVDNKVFAESPQGGESDGDCLN